MVASEIAKIEKISISEKEYSTEISSIIEEFSYESEDKFLENYANHPENYLYESFIFDKVTDYLKEKNTMVYVEATDDATTGATTTTAATETTTAKKEEE